MLRLSITAALCVIAVPVAGFASTCSPFAVQQIAVAAGPGLEPIQVACTRPTSSPQGEVVVFVVQPEAAPSVVHALILDTATKHVEAAYVGGDLAFDGQELRRLRLFRVGNWLERNTTAVGILASYGLNSWDDTTSLTVLVREGAHLRPVLTDLVTSYAFNSIGHLNCNGGFSVELQSTVRTSPNPRRQFPDLLVTSRRSAAVGTRNPHPGGECIVGRSRDRTFVHRLPYADGHYEIPQSFKDLMQE